MSDDESSSYDTEIVFVQKMASGEPITRRRAFRTLCNWIKKRSLEAEFGDESLMRLCKGLHYVLWMQDKMLWQEQLADNIASLITMFNTEIESVRFVKSMLKTLSNEWSIIDRWRMDKFLMLIRRFIRALFAHLRMMEWQTSAVDLYINAFKECVISADTSFSEGLKFHFASIYLDELDGAGGLHEKQATHLLKPFAELLSNPAVTDYLFTSVIDEVFISILHLYAEEKAARELRKNAKSQSLDEGGIKFDYEEISKMLLKAGMRPEVKSCRRKRLYNVAKKFKALVVGIDPIPTVSEAETRIKQSIPKREIANAVSRLINLETTDRERLKKSKRITKKSIKKQHEPEEANSNEASAKRGSKLRKVKKGKISKIRKHKKLVIARNQS